MKLPCGSTRVGQKRGAKLVLKQQGKKTKNIPFTNACGKTRHRRSQTPSPTKQLVLHSLLSHSSNVRAYPNPVLLQGHGLGRQEVDVPLRYHSEDMESLRLVLQVSHVFHLLDETRTTEVSDWADSSKTAKLIANSTQIT